MLLGLCHLLDCGITSDGRTCLMSVHYADLLVLRIRTFGRYPCDCETSMLAAHSLCAIGTLLVVI